MSCAESLCGGEVLRVGVGADAFLDELIGGGDDDFVGLGACDEGEHHVGGGETAGAGEVLAFDLKEVGGHFDLRKSFHEGVEVFPVYGGDFVFEQTCGGEDPGTCADGAELCVRAVQAVEPSEEFVIFELRDIFAADEDESV